MSELPLAELPLGELRDLQDKVEQAIRARIREKNAARATGGAAVKPVAEATPPIDLERERDAWLAKR